MEKSIGIGIEDFKKVINENCYYIDKTKWIEEIIKDKSEIKLFTRPRRFGKTLTYSLPFFIKKFLYPLSYSIIKYFSS